MVGTSTEELESCKDINRSISVNFVPVDNSNLSLDANCSNATSLYGTYDEKTNSINLILPNGEKIRLDDVDAIEEIICEEIDDDTMFDWNSDSVRAEEMKPPLMYPNPKRSVEVLKSPVHSVVSDSGYESLGSPTHHDHTYDENFNDLWNSVSELFPSLA